MIIITGANGQLGRAVTERLLERVPSDRIGVSVRDPDQAMALQERGVRVRRGDFTDPSSLAEAFEGATQILITSVNATGEEAVRQHRTAIDTAKAVGVQRIFYTSHMGSNPASPFPPMRDHAATEDALRESGLAFTSLHNGFYASSAVMMLSGALQTGELAVPEDGPVSWTAHADLASVAAVALSEGGLDGVTPPLTASEAVPMAGLAALASEVAGRPIRHVTVSDSAYRDGLIGHGLPVPAAEMLLGIFLASRQGDFAEVDPTLTRLLGQPAVSLRSVLEAAIAAPA